MNAVCIDAFNRRRNNALLCLKEGRVAEALRVLDSLVEECGDGSLRGLLCLGDRVEALFDMGLAASALEEQRGIVETLESRFREEHCACATMRLNLVGFLACTGQYGHALHELESLEDRVGDFLAAADETRDWACLKYSFLSKKLDILRSLGRESEARGLRGQLERHLEKVDPGFPGICLLRFNIASLLEEEGDNEKALMVLKELPEEDLFSGPLTGA